MTNPLFLPWRVGNGVEIIDCAECEVAHIDTGDAAHDELIAKCIVALVNRVYKMPNSGVEP